MIIVEIGGIRQQVKIDGFSLEDAIDERSTCEFSVVNKDYDKEFFKGQPVKIHSFDIRGTDFDAGKFDTVTLGTEEFFIQPEYVLSMDTEGEPLFSGVIDSSEGEAWQPDGPLFYRIMAVDWHYAADKRLAARAYENEYAGDIVIDLWENYLKDEGIAFGYAPTKIVYNHRYASLEDYDNNIISRLEHLGYEVVAIPNADVETYDYAANNIHGFIVGPPGADYTAHTSGAFIADLEMPVLSFCRHVARNNFGMSTESMNRWVDSFGVAKSHPITSGLTGQHIIGSSSLSQVLSSLTSGTDLIMHNVLDNSDAGIAERVVTINHADYNRMFFGYHLIGNMNNTGLRIFGRTIDYVLGEITSVDDGPEVAEAVYNYVYISDALDALAERTGMWWKIDEHRRLYFRERAAYTGPWVVTGTDILRNSLSVVHNASKYRNRQVVRGARDLTSQHTEVKMGDGEEQSFTVGYPIAKVPTVEVDTGAGYVAQTVGIKGLEDGKHWYWSKGDPVVTQDALDTPLSATDKIRIVYYGEFPLIVITQNNTAIFDRATVEEVGTGWVENISHTSQDTTREGAYELASGLIEKYSTIGKTVRFRTLRHGMRAGHIATVNLPEAGLNNTEVLIDAITINSIGAGRLIYDIQGVEGPEVGSWTKFFKAIVQAGEIAIREGIGSEEIIIEPYTFTKTWVSTEAPNIFLETYPHASEPLYDDTHGLSFAAADRVKYLEWHFGGVAQERKAVTQATGLTEGSAEVYTLTYLESFEAIGTHSHLAWIGGIEATATLGTGVEVDKQAHAETKGNQVAWQIEKTDSKWV